MEIDPPPMASVVVNNSHDEDKFVKFNPPLGVQRYNYAFDIMFKDVSRVVRMADFGCSEGHFFRYLKKLPYVEQISLVDIRREELEEATFHASPLPWDLIFGRSFDMKVNLFQGNIIQPDERLVGLDAITLIEVIEHLDFDTLNKIPASIFGYYQPRIVIMSTPNSEFNVHFEQLKEGQFRHWDHKFEWSRSQFANFCFDIIATYSNYDVTFGGVGDPMPGFEHVGHCSQFAIFRKQHPNTQPMNFPAIRCFDLVQEFTYPKRSKALQNDKDQEPFDWDVILKSDRADLADQIKAIKID